QLGPGIDHLKETNGVVRGGVADGRPDILNDVQACEMILTLSGTTNGRLATEGFKQLETRTGTQLHDLAAENEGHRVTFRDTQHGPAPVITSPEWSGSETGGRRDRKSTRLNSSHVSISYAVFCLKKKHIRLV